jgi:hypothetical protein
MVCGCVLVAWRLEREEAKRLHRLIEPMKNQLSSASCFLPGAKLDPCPTPVLRRHNHLACVCPAVDSELAGDVHP